MNFEQFGYVEKNGILAFLGGPLSQWYNENSSFFMDEIRYKSVEQYKQASKANLFDDFDKEEEILLEGDPIINSQQGREVKNFDQSIWDNHVQSFIFWGNLMKFRYNSELREILYKTNDLVLVEASDDKIWGCGYKLNREEIFDKDKWTGENTYGKILMDVRDIILTD